MGKIQDAHWTQHYEELVAFVKTNKRYPSRHHPEEHRLLNWLKYNRKMINKGLLRDDRRLLMNELQSLRELQYIREDLD